MIWIFLKTINQLILKLFLKLILEIICIVFIFRNNFNWIDLLIINNFKDILFLFRFLMKTIKGKTFIMNLFLLFILISIFVTIIFYLHKIEIIFINVLSFPKYTITNIIFKWTLALFKLVEYILLIYMIIIFWIVWITLKTPSI